MVKDVQKPRQARRTLGWVWRPRLIRRSTANGKEQTIRWQLDGKHYEYWVHAAEDGSFTIPAARVGNYVLYAFNDGILGEFSKANVTVAAGRTVDLGQIDLEAGALWPAGLGDRHARSERR